MFFIYFAGDRSSIMRWQLYELSVSAFYQRVTFITFLPTDQYRVTFQIIVFSWALLCAFSFTHFPTVWSGWTAKTKLIKKTELCTWTVASCHWVQLRDGCHTHFNKNALLPVPLDRLTRPQSVMGKWIGWDQFSKQLWIYQYHPRGSKGLLNATQCDCLDLKHGI